METGVTCVPLILLARQKLQVAPRVLTVLPLLMRETSDGKLVNSDNFAMYVYIRLMC